MHSRSEARPGAGRLGRVGGTLAEALAWLNSPAAIAGEIAALERAILAGDETEEKRTLLADWRAIQRAQRALLADESTPGIVE